MVSWNGIFVKRDADLYLEHDHSPIVPRYFPPNFAKVFILLYIYLYIYEVALVV